MLRDEVGVEQVINNGPTMIKRIFTKLNTLVYFVVVVVVVVDMESSFLLSTVRVSVGQIDYGTFL
jgi:hypothetical protein